MGLLKFEIRKLFKQRKLVWVLIAIILITSGLYWMNHYQRSRQQGNWARYNAYEELSALEEEWSKRQWPLMLQRDEIGLTNEEERQLEYLLEMEEKLHRVRVTMNYGNWREVPRYEQEFLDVLQKYIDVGGEFSALEGMERDIAIEKNTWLVENNLGYEYELAPTTPHLFLKDSSTIILGLIGVLILVFLFGNTLTEEKESSTWKIITTQPVSKANLIISKYISILISVIIYVLISISVGLIIPLLIQTQPVNLDYPQVLVSNESYKIIPTYGYIIRSAILFICASSVIFSIAFFTTKWVKKFFTSFILIGIVIIIGYFMTSSIKSLLNPFYLLNFNEILSKVPGNTDWIYILSSVIWTCVFLGLTICLPDKEFKLVESIEKRVSDWTSNTRPFANGQTKTDGKLLWKVHTFEWRKTRRENLLKIFSITLIILIFVGYVFVTFLARQREKIYLDELNWRAATLENYIFNAEKGLEESYAEREALEDVDPQEYSDYQRRFMDDFDEMVAYMENMREESIKNLSMLEKGIESYKEGDWRGLYEYQISVIEKAMDGYSPVGTSSGMLNLAQMSMFTEEISLKEKEWLIEHDIRPVFSGEFIPTRYQFWGNFTRRFGWRNEIIESDQKKQWEYQNKNIDNSGLFYLYLAFTNYTYLLPLILLLLFAGGGIAKERSTKSNTFLLLKTLPIPRHYVFTGKIINALKIVFIFTLTVPILIILVGTVLNRFGDLKFPISYFNSAEVTMSPDYTGLTAGYGYGYHFITLGKYLLDSTLLFVSISLFIISLSTVISLFFKRTLSVFALTIMILGGGYWLNARKPLLMSPKSPFTYFDIPRVVNGDLGARINDPMFNTQTGIFVLLGLTILILGLGILVVNWSKIQDISEKIKLGK